MIRRTATLLLLLLPVLLAAQDYPFPARVPVAGMPVSMPNSTRSQEMPQSLLQNYAENFHPIGWSDDGKAAWMTWSESESTTTFGVIVYDAVKDTIAGSWFEQMGDNIYLEESQLPAFWQRDRDSIFPLLRRFRITPSTPAYADFPASFGNRQYTIEYTLYPTPADSRLYDRLAGSFIITENGANRRLPVDWSGFSGFNVQPAGIWLSPGQQYALVIVLDETGSQDGTMQPYHIHFRLRRVSLQ